MTINTVARNIFFEAARKWRWENDTHVELEDHTAFGCETLVVKVNWSCVGAVYPEEAAKFADAINAAVAVATAVNSLKLKVDYKLDSDPWIVCREDCEWAKEFLSGLILTGDLERLTAWLEMHSTED